jgi:hypothetical protein
MNNVTRKRFIPAALLVIVVGVLAFGSVPLAGGASSSGATQRGAIGIDLDCPSVTCPDFGIDQQLQKPAKTGLDDAHVVVIASQCSADDTPSPGTCSDSNETDGGAPFSQSEDENLTACPSTWANGQLPNSPRAASGFVCVYVLGGTNFGTIIGGGAIHGSSNAPGTLSSTLGFKVGWNPDNAGDTYIDAVWAYNKG